MFLLELFEGRATSWPDWHLGALRQQGRVGVKVEFSTASPAATAISAKNSAASPIGTRSPAATRIRPVFLPRHGFGKFFLPRHGFGQGLDSFSKTGVTLAYELRFRRTTYQTAQGKESHRFGSCISDVFSLFRSVVYRSCPAAFRVICMVRLLVANSRNSVSQSGWWCQTWRAPRTSLASREGGCGVAGRQDLRMEKNRGDVKI